MALSSFSLHPCSRDAFSLTRPSALPALLWTPPWCFGLLCLCCSLTLRYGCSTCSHPMWRYTSLCPHTGPLCPEPLKQYSEHIPSESRLSHFIFPLLSLNWQFPKGRACTTSTLKTCLRGERAQSEFGSLQGKLSTCSSYFYSTNFYNLKSQSLLQENERSRAGHPLTLRKSHFYWCASASFHSVNIEVSCIVIKNRARGCPLWLPPTHSCCLKPIFPVSPSHCQVPPASCAMWKASVFYFAQPHLLKFYCAELDQAQAPKYQFKPRSGA